MRRSYANGPHCANGFWKTRKDFSCSARSRLRRRRGTAGDRVPTSCIGARVWPALEWAAANRGELNVLERAFLDASKQQAEREASEREAQRRRELIAAVKLAETEKQRAEESTLRGEKTAAARVFAGRGIGAFAGLVGGRLFPGRSGAHERTAAENSSALRTRTRKKRNRKSASQPRANWRLRRTNNLTIDPERSILLAMQAVAATAQDKTVLPEAASALHAAIQTSRVTTEPCWDIPALSTVLP